MAEAPFQSHEEAKLYAKFRPKYSDDLKKIVLDYAKETSSFQYKTLLDVACGSGQSTFPWKDDFDICFGIDRSMCQLEEAKSLFPNISFSVGNAEQLSFDNNSVDLITIGAALHWVEREKFYKEARRVLKPGGVLGAFCYSPWMIQLDDTAATSTTRSIVNSLYEENQFQPQLSHGSNLYKDISLPFRDFKREYIDMVYEWDLDEIVGFISSLSMFAAFVKKHPQSTLMKEFRNKLQDIYNGSEKKVKICLPLVVLLGRK